MTHAGYLVALLSLEILQRALLSFWRGTGQRGPVQCGGAGCGGEGQGVAGSGVVWLGMV